MGMDIFITKLLLLLLILSLTPPVLSHRWHPRLINTPSLDSSLRSSHMIRPRHYRRPGNPMFPSATGQVSYAAGADREWFLSMFQAWDYKALKGSVGYIPPEYGLGGRITTKGDVYSYGIVLLEMLTGKEPTHSMFVEGMTLQKWVGSSFPYQVRAVVDRSLLRRISTSIVEDKEFNCLNQLVSVALLCTKESPEERPTMMDIVGKLQSFKEILLGVVRNTNFQSDLTHLLGCPSTSHNIIGEGQSSSTF